MKKDNLLETFDMTGKYVEGADNCPYCGHGHECASPQKHNSPPSDGDFSVCIRCRLVAKFRRTDDGRYWLEGVAPADLEELVSTFVETFPDMRLRPVEAVYLDGSRKWGVVIR